MGEANDKIYEFKEFRLVTEDGTLWRGKERIPITQKTVELLTLLIEHRGHVVSRDHILERLWPETYVDENNLSVTISMLRKALGENAMRSDMIETIPRKGYRFNGDVRATPAIDEIIAVREITRAVVEQTHFEDENASQTLIALQKGSRRHRAMLAILSVTLGAVIAVLSIGYLIQKIPFSTRKVYSIAVLPLRNLTGSEAEQALAYGVTDSVVTKLSKVRGLAVRPIASVADLTDVQTDTVQIGKRLGVDAVLEGSIQRSGDLYRVSIRIHSIADDQIIWGSTIEHQVSQVFDLQRLIALQTLEGLAVKLSDIDQRGLRGSPTEDPEAYREYAIGRFHLAKRTPTDIRRAIAKFENAIEQDVAFAGAFAGLATSYMLLSDSAIGVMPPKDGFPKAIDFANKAIALDPDCAEAHAVLGYSKTGYEWQLADGERELRMAADLNPSDATIRLWLGWNLIAQQRFFEADEELASAERLDPTSLITVADRGYAAYFQGDLERAIDHFRRAADLDANYPPSRFNLARALLRAGRVDEARAQIDALSRIVPTESAVYQMFLGCVLARSGQMVDARRIYNDLRDLQRNGEFMSPNFTATLAIELGETDEAISDIERLLDERNEYVPYLRSAPEFEKIRSDPRFELVLIAAGI